MSDYPYNIFTVTVNALIPRCDRSEDTSNGKLACVLLRKLENCDEVSGGSWIGHGGKQRDERYLEAHKFTGTAEPVGLHVLSRADELYRY